MPVQIGFERSRLGDLRRDGNDAVVEGLGIKVITLKDGIPGISDRGIDTKSAHDEGVLTALASAATTGLADGLALFGVEHRGVLIFETFQLLALDFLFDKGFH